MWIGEESKGEKNKRMQNTMKTIESADLNTNVGFQEPENQNSY